MKSFRYAIYNIHNFIKVQKQKYQVLYDTVNVHVINASYWSVGAYDTKTRKCILFLTCVKQLNTDS